MMNCKEVAFIYIFFSTKTKKYIKLIYEPDVAITPNEMERFQRIDIINLIKMYRMSSFTKLVKNLTMNITVFIRF